MKNTYCFLLFISLLFMGQLRAQQDKQIEKLWQQTDTLLIKDRQPRTALQKVNAIAELAEKAGLKDQIIKTILYKIAIEKEIEDQDPDLPIRQVDSAINASRDPVARSLLTVLKANIIISYYQGNRWQINGRAVTARRSMDNVTTWSASDFDQAIDRLFKTALSPARQLQQTPNKNFSAIVTKGNTEKIRPTIYDLILHEALDYYKNQPQSGVQPEQPFTLTDKTALAGADKFSKHTFEGPMAQDSLSSQWLALQYFQAALRFHLQDKNPAARLDVDIERLEWSYNQLPADPGSEVSSGSDNADDPGQIGKDQLYLQTLTALIRDYPEADQAKEAAFLKASYYSNRAAKFQPLSSSDTLYQGDYRRALDIINTFYPLDKNDKEGKDAEINAAVKAKSKGEAELLNLRSQILTPTSEVKLESVNLPDQPFRALVTYRNISKLYFKIVRVPVAPGSSVHFDQKTWSGLLKESSVASFARDLPVTTDYQTHRTEIKLPPLQGGAYVLLVSRQSIFSMDEGLAAGEFSVSSIAYVRHGNHLFILDREKGTPLAGAKVNFYSKKWEQRAYKYNKVFSLVTDKDGAIQIGDQIDKSQLQIQDITVYNGEDSLAAGSYFYRTYQNANDNDDAESTKRLSFFTDRSIYRPGQIVYFKGIASLNYKNGQRSTLFLSDKSWKVQLYDANNQKVDSLSLQLNQYGSLTGTFTLPEGLLPGTFTLRSDELEGSLAIQVEAYKRPTYFVTIDSLKDALKLGDSVTVQGTAMAYAGNAVDQASVQINISRTVIYPYPWLRSSRYMPMAPRQGAAIAHGSVKTDAKGRFSYTFKATGGNEEEMRGLANFHFQIEAAVTDGNGETQQGRQTMVLGSQPFMIQLQIPDEPSDLLLDSVILNTQNAAGKFVAQQVHLKVTPLQAPERLIRKRLWEQPDTYVMDSAAFIKLFPHDEYSNELDKNNWPRKAVVFEKEVTTTANGHIAIDRHLAPGWYVVEATAPGRGGQTIKDQRYVYLYEPGSPLGAFPVYQWENASETSVKVGQMASLQVASSADPVYLLHSLTRMESGKSKTIFGHLQLKDHKGALHYKLLPADVAGAQMDYLYVRDNRIYAGSLRISLEDTTEPLTIHYQTYRDKVEPGAKEQWSLSINKEGKNWKNVELLSAMYDGSLDAFREHHWNIPGLNAELYLSADSWNGQDDFSTNSTGEWQGAPAFPQYQFDKDYDQLIFNSRLAAQNSRHIMLRGMAGGVAVKGLRADAAMAPMMEKSKSGNADNLDEVVIAGYGKQDSTEPPAELQQQAVIRSDFKETAFFLPQLHSDAAGNFKINFQVPDALTTWRWMNLAYDKDLHFVTDVKNIVAQKTLMIQPNLPRFLRSSDQIRLTAKISNLSDKVLAGKAALILTDPATGKVLDAWSGHRGQEKNFSVPAGESSVVDFNLAIPVDFTGPVQVLMKASAGNFSDAEQNMLPVLTNQMMVTETLPIYMKQGGSESFSLEKLIKSGAPSATGHSIQHKALVFEYTTNPVWYSVTALPNLTASTDQRAEQLFNQVYTDVVGAHIIDTYPEIAKTLQGWLADNSTNALQSNLDKNPALKTVLLEQTPWVLEAQDEAAQKSALARFFNKTALKAKEQAAIKSLTDLQLPEGGFSWLPGGRADLYITQRIITGIGQLHKMDLLRTDKMDPLMQVAAAGSNYLIQEYKTRYEKWLTEVKKTDAKKGKQSEFHPGASEIQYLYMRSFFVSKADLNDGEHFYLEQEVKNWQQQPVYLQLMIAVSQYRFGNPQFAVEQVLNSVLQRAVQSETLGMYWKQNEGYYRWYDAPIETQALAISILEEIGTQNAHPTWNGYSAALQRWLIAQKQTNRWPTANSTVDAIYALLGANKQPQYMPAKITVQLGAQTLEVSAREAGSGYFKRSIPVADIKPEMGQVKIKIEGNNGQSASPSYGALYWQYVAPISQVEASEAAPSGLTLKKQLFMEEHTSGGKRLVAISSKTPLKVGDKLVVRITFSTDREMDYMHLRDMRGAGTQPDQTISGYHGQDGLSYYQTTGDVTTDFFFDHVTKGTYVFDYPVHISHMGIFAAGTATLESMYAPEFSAHSEGFVIDVKE
ncbi:MAG TPA: alpha-2-macroglobulin family protein [Arachidicoccus sp.]|nr:alpha-2-macroglobulin family protein [Arachidicoccus sp.]